MPWFVSSVLARLGSRALPLRQIVGDHARRFHRGLSELGITGQLALDALTFVVISVRRPSSSAINVSISLTEAPATRWISVLTLETAASAVGSAGVSVPGAGGVRLR